jgi:DNA-binding MarR family transcriptional regulator
MAVTLPLPALLSVPFVAFTIEADNELEQMVAHRTTSFGTTGERGAVWLTSMAMWFNCLRPLATAGESLSVAELGARARMETNLDGMRRWGYITIDGVGRVRRGSQARPRARTSSVLALTPRGEAAAEAWHPVPALIEQRWRERFGAAAVERLRGALLAVAGQDEAALPDFLPIGEISATPGPRSDSARQADAELGLASLLARVLMRFRLDHRERSPVPLRAWSDLLRVLDPETGVPVRDLPRLTGISKEALAVLSGRLGKAEVILSEPLPDGGRGRQLRLTPRGAQARTRAERAVEETVLEWGERAAALSGALVELVGDGTREGSPLWAGLQPPAEGWRAHAAPPELLPWYPMLTHRGGYPDGS